MFRLGGKRKSNGKGEKRPKVLLEPKAKMKHWLEDCIPRHRAMKMIKEALDLTNDTQKPEGTVKIGLGDQKYGRLVNTVFGISKVFRWETFSPLRVPA